MTEEQEEILWLKIRCEFNISSYDMVKIRLNEYIENFHNLNYKLNKYKFLFYSSLIINFSLLLFNMIY